VGSHSSRGGIRGWVKSRYGRTPYLINSPLHLEEVAARLSENLGVSVFDSLKYVGKIEPVDDSKWFLTFSLPQGRNSFTRVLKAEITDDGVGSSLSGTIGPPEWLRYFSTFCVGFLGLILVVGVLTLTSSCASLLDELLLVLVPLGMIGILLGLSELSTRHEQRQWRTADEWLRQLLKATVQ